MKNLVEKTYKAEIVRLQDNPEFQEAFASFSNNPLFNYIGFVLTDDKPNANKQRIPKDEFSSLIKSGFHTPLKMELGTIGDHPNSVPIGVITHLTEKDDTIKAIATLWSEEFKDNISIIQEYYEKKKPLNVSWEIRYRDSEIDDDGVENLHGTLLRAATIVAIPAYGGRTPITAFASKQEEDITLDELKELKDKLDEATAQLTEKTQELDQKVAELATTQEELETLREFKAEVERKEADAEKLNEIKAKFAEAGLEKDEDYFEQNKETLLALTPESLDFMIQELKAFASTIDRKAESTSSTSIPNFTNSDDNIDVGALVKELRARLNK